VSPYFESQTNVAIWDH